MIIYKGIWGLVTRLKRAPLAFGVSVSDDNLVSVGRGARSSEEAKLPGVSRSEQLKKPLTIADHCPSFHLNSEPSLIGIPPWHSRLPWLLLRGISSTFHASTLVSLRFLALNTNSEFAQIVLQKSLINFLLFALLADFYIVFFEEVYFPVHLIAWFSD